MKLQTKLQMKKKTGTTGTTKNLKRRNFVHVHAQKTGAGIHTSKKTSIKNFRKEKHKCKLESR